MKVNEGSDRRGTFEMLFAGWYVAQGPWLQTPFSQDRPFSVVRRRAFRRVTHIAILRT